ncbi:MAG: glycosyltransferase [Verrucomicrobiales bacterium]
MISILIVVSWHGHHPSYCTQFIRACASFSEKVYAIVPEGSDPLDRLEEFPDVISETVVIPFANRYPKCAFGELRALENDFDELRTLVGSIKDSHPGSSAFIFHTDLGTLVWNFRHLPRLAFRASEWFPWPFGGLLISPDRRWPLEGIRESLCRAIGKGGQPGSPARLLLKISGAMLDMAGALMRSCYLNLRNLAFRKSTCCQIAIEDERYLEPLRLATGTKTHFLPETTSVEVAVPAPDLVGRIESKRNGLVVVGILGAISPRKGIDLLADVIKNQNTDGFLFVLAGPCVPSEFPPAISDFLQNEISNYGNVIYSPHTIVSEPEFNAIIQACDILYCAYKGHIHSSNVISKAAAFRKPVIVSDGELMAKRVREYGLGVVLRGRNSTACLEALRELAAPGFREAFGKSAKSGLYMEEHSFESLQQAMASLAREQTGEA